MHDVATPFIPMSGVVLFGADLGGEYQPTSRTDIPRPQRHF